MDQLADSYGLECAGGSFSGCGLEAEKCKKNGGRFLGKSFDSCPLFELLEDKRLSFVMQLERESGIAPIAGWPDSHAAWVPALISELKAARQDRENSELQSIRSKSKV